MGAAKDVFDEMADNWPSEIIARTEIKVFTGGLISPGYIANLDSKGEGPFGRIKTGRKTCYPKRPFVKWLRERSRIENNPEKNNLSKKVQKCIHW
ncbi:MAG: hypothetical protein COX19_04410 [Desulfobacterales bacterium CG23_combo_of_CG06-09_8_20_14_all_51_8]|nr:MAG: hypothetical protein COX19_04410 [Desulfobacterales bacterium CG23_combo_of_CG06-09_8_20_14_all_51_8]